MDIDKSKIIAVYLYVSKNLDKNPKKVIKFIKSNIKYFPTITNKEIDQLMIEYNLTSDDINLEPIIII